MCGRGTGLGWKDCTRHWTFIKEAGVLVESETRSQRLSPGSYSDTDMKFCLFFESVIDLSGFEHCWTHLG